MNWFREFLLGLYLAFRRLCTGCWDFVSHQLLPQQKNPERNVRSLRIGRDHPKARLGVAFNPQDSFVDVQPKEETNALLENVFRFFDIDGSGHISRSEIRQALKIYYVLVAAFYRGSDRNFTNFYITLADKVVVHSTYSFV